MKRKITIVTIAVLAVAVLSGAVYWCLPEGRLVDRVKRYDADGNWMQTVRYTYQGEQLIREETEIDGGIKEYTTYEYADGHCVAAHYFKPNGTEKNYTKYEYDGDRLTRSTVYNTSSKQVKSVTVVDGETQTTTDSDGRLVQTKVSQTVDGQVISERVSDSKGRARSSLTFQIEKSDGGTVRRCSAYENGVLQYTEEYEYGKALFE